MTATSFRRKTIFAYLPHFIFGIIFIVTIIFRLKAVENYNTAFTSDQARDMLEIRQMAVLHTPKLIGPITDIIGLYLGPFWYYFNLLPFLISGGNPLSLVHFSILFLHLVSITIFYFLEKQVKTLGLFVSSVLLLSPIAFLTTRYSFNANAVFFFSALYPLFILFKSRPSSFLEGLLGGILLQLQAAIGVLFFPISIFLHQKRDKKDRHLTPLFFGFFLTLVPQIIFELTHRFLMTKAFLSEFLGQTSFLGGKLTIGELLANRYSHYLSIFSGVSHLPIALVLLTILVASILFTQKSITYRLLKTNLQILLFFFIFFLIFPFTLKDWYLFGLVPFAVFAFSSSLQLLCQTVKGKFVSGAVLILIIFSSFSSNFSYLDSLPKTPSLDPSNLHNLLTVIDTVYETSSGESFKIFSYLPSVYDYHFQYLFWWYGTKKYGYQPAEIAYLPGVPEYVKNNQQFWNQKRNSSSPLTFLLIQHDREVPERESNWREQFPLATESSLNFPWNITLEKLKPLLNLKQ